MATFVEVGEWTINLELVAALHRQPDGRAVVYYAGSDRNPVTLSSADAQKLAALIREDGGAAKVPTGV